MKVNRVMKVVLDAALSAPTPHPTTDPTTDPTPVKVARSSGRGSVPAPGRARGRASTGGRGRGRRARVNPDLIVPEAGWSRTVEFEPPTISDFTEMQGPATPLPANTAPIAIFEQMFGVVF